jgi:predicted nuclease with TOPRIM domain
MSEREMELAEYLKALKPDHVRLLVVQNGRLLHERDAMKTTIAAVTADNLEAMKRINRLEAECTKLRECAKQLEHEVQGLRSVGAR